MTNPCNVAAILNNLIATLLDSAAGYEESVGEISDQAVAEKFGSRARERQSAAEKLKAAVSAGGGEPIDRGTITGTMRRAFVDLKGI